MNTCHPCDEESGFCTLHIFVTPADRTAVAASVTATSRLIAHVTWQAGLSGGKCDFDITGGAILGFCATNAIEVIVEQVDTVVLTAGGAFAAPTAPGEDLAVQCQAAWGGQAPPPRAGYMTGLRQVAAANVAGVPLLIPDHAQRVRIMTDVAAASITTITLFPAGTAPVAIYTGVSRLGDAGGEEAVFPIVLGAKTYTMTSSVNGNVFALFDMVP